MSLEVLMNMNGRQYGCGKLHSFSGTVLAAKGAIRKLPEQVRRLSGSRVYLISDKKHLACCR